MIDLMLFRNNWHHKHYKNPQQYCTSQSLTSGHVSPSSPSDSQSIKARRSSWTRLIPGGSNSKNERKNKFHKARAWRRFNCNPNIIIFYFDCWIFIDLINSVFIKADGNVSICHCRHCIKSPLQRERLASRMGRAHSIFVPDYDFSKKKNK